MAISCFVCVALNLKLFQTCKLCTCFYSLFVCNHMRVQEQVLLQIKHPLCHCQGSQGLSNAEKTTHDSLSIFMKCQSFNSPQDDKTFPVKIAPMKFFHTISLGKLTSNVLYRDMTCSFLPGHEHDSSSSISLPPFITFFQYIHCLYSNSLSHIITHYLFLISYPTLFQILLAIQIPCILHTLLFLHYLTF